MWSSYALLHLKADLLIGASLINCFKTMVSASENTISKEAAIATKMRELKDTSNILWEVIKTKNFNKQMKAFEICENTSFFPDLPLTDLEDIALGSYQIRMSHSYCAEHLKENNCFELFEFPSELVNRFFAHFSTIETTLHLVLARIKSRFISKKRHHTFVLVDENKRGPAGISGYCCSCKNGLRTVGCCSHVMSIIWYHCYALRNNRSLPVAGFLNDYFHNDDDDDSEYDDV